MAKPAAQKRQGGLQGSRAQMQSTPLQPAPVIPLLAPKLQPPHLITSSLIPRKRLLERLDAGLERKLTLITAPAGSGKTTLASQWALERSKLPDFPPAVPPLGVAWVSLDTGDNDPVRFWRYVITACQDIDIHLGHSLALLSNTSLSPFQPIPLEAVTTTLLNDLAQLPQKGILVLEDYHLINDHQIQSTMAAFIEHLPPTLHLVILTRVEPPLPLARLRAYNDLNELHAADLRFTPDEMRIFLEQTIGVQIPPQAITGLESHTEGWAVGLRLMALALQGCREQQEIARVIENFSGSQRPILEYLVTEVLQTQPAPLQQFLLQTSVLERLTGPLCDAITGEKESTELLEQLERSNLFLVALDGKREWYRYHMLFAEAMQYEARRRLGKNGLRQLYDRASQWYEEHGLMSESIEAAFSTEAYERVVGLMEQITKSHIATGYNERQTWRRWLEMLPETALHASPILCFSYAETLAFPARQSSTIAARFEKYLRIAENLWRTAGNIHRIAEINTLRSLVCWWRKEYSQAISYARLALTDLPEEAIGWRSISLAGLGSGERLAGRLHNARKFATDAYTLSKATDNLYAERAISLGLADNYYEQGQLHQAAELYHQIIATAGDDASDRGRAQLGLALIAYEWNELDSAEEKAQQAYELSQQKADEPMSIQASVLLIQLLHTRGDIIQARQRLTSLIARIQIAKTPHLYREALALQAMFQLESNDFSAVQRWFDNRHIYNELLNFVQREREEILAIRLLIAQGKELEALQQSQQLLGPAQQEGRFRNALVMQVLMALIYFAQKQEQEARHILREVITFTHAEGHIRLFLDEGETMAILLRTILLDIREKPLIAYLRLILSAFDKEIPGQETSRSSMNDLLSAQEMRVLRLLAAGYSKPEIAEEMIISINTVKTHVKNIYRKLKVSSRIEVYETARRLQLL